MRPCSYSMHHSSRNMRYCSTFMLLCRSLKQLCRCHNQRCRWLDQGRRSRHHPCSLSMLNCRISMLGCDGSISDYEPVQNGGFFCMWRCGGCSFFLLNSSLLAKSEFKMGCFGTMLAGTFGEGSARSGVTPIIRKRELLVH